MNNNKLFFHNLDKEIIQNSNKQLYLFFFKKSIFNNININYYDLIKRYYNIISNSEKKKYDYIFDKVLLINKKNISNNTILNKILFKNIEKSLLLNYKSTIESVKNLNKKFSSERFLDSLIISDFKLKNKKCNIIYNTFSGMKYFFNSLKFKFDEKNLENFFNKNNIINNKKIFNNNNFFFDKNNISNIYKNYIYYNFDPLNDIKVYLKSNFNKKKINILLHIKQNKIYINRIKFFFPHKEFFIKNINIKIGNSKDNKLYKTIFYKGYKLKILKKLSYYNPKNIINSILLKPNNIFSNEDIFLTKKNIYFLNNFFIKEFNIKESLKTLNIKNNKKELGKLNLNINLIPMKKYKMIFSLENMISKYNKKNLILSPKIYLLIRNIFNNGENLEFFLINNYSFLEKELIIQNKIFFPKLLFPLNFFLKQRKFLYSIINNKIIFSKKNNYKKLFFSSYIDFFWKKNYYNKHIIRLFNFELKKENKNFFINKKIELSEFKIKNYYINNKEKYYFINKNFNNYIINNYLFNYISYKYVYNQYINKNIKNPLYLFFNIKLSDNLILLLDSIINNYNKNYFIKSKHYRYYNINLNIKKYWTFNKNISLFSKFFFGTYIPYGQYKDLPLEKSYYCGGTNDIKAWHMYSLGPGSSKKYLNNISFSNMKIISNLELKFRINNNIFFTTFIDGGNIWDLINKNNNNNGKFYLNKFYKQIALGGGFGLLYNLKLFLLRLDISYKIINPAKKYISYWNFNNLNNPIINFTIEQSF